MRRQIPRSRGIRPGSLPSISDWEKPELARNGNIDRNGRADILGLAVPRSPLLLLPRGRRCRLWRPSSRADLALAVDRLEALGIGVEHPGAIEGLAAFLLLELGEI